MTISRQKIDLFFRLSISTVVLGALFEFMRWLYGWPLIALGAIGMVVFHSIQFYQKQHKTPLDYSRLLLIVAFFLNYMGSVLQLPFGHVLIVLTKVALMAFLLFYIKEIVFPHTENIEGNTIPTFFGRENLSYLLSDLSTVYIVIASLFKILHWEFGILTGNLLLILGLLTALVSILASSRRLGN